MNVRWQLVIPQAEGSRGEVPERSEEMRKRLEFLKQTPTYTINSNKGLVLATYTFLKQLNKSDYIRASLISSNEVC